MWLPQITMDPRRGFHGDCLVGPLLGFRRSDLATPPVAAGYERDGAVVLGVVGDHEVHVAVHHDLRLGVDGGIQIVAVDAGADAARPLHPGGAQAQHAVGAEQVLGKTETGGVVGEAFEGGILPQHEALDVVDVGPPFRRKSVRPVAAQHGPLQRLADLLDQFRGTDLLRRHHREPERCQFRDVGFQVELPELPMQQRHRTGGFPVPYLHGRPPRPRQPRIVAPQYAPAAD